MRELKIWAEIRWHSSDERRHKRKKSVSSERRSRNKRRRIRFVSSRDSCSSSSSSSEEQRSKKRTKKHTKRKSKNHRRIKSPTLETSRFRIVNQEHQFKWGLSDLMAEYANGHLNILIQEKRSNIVNSKVHSSPIKLTRSKTNG